MKLNHLNIAVPDVAATRSFFEGFFELRCGETGIMLYEMLTGSLPFTASHPMEWVHCHIARKPVRPSLLMRRPTEQDNIESHALSRL